MSKRLVFPACILVALGIVSAPAAFADTIIKATQSCRTDVTARGANKHDSSKLSVRSDDKSAKSWIKFDISGLDVGNLETATLTVALHEAKTGNRNFDVSYVNDDCLDNIAWDERNLTWDNAPGNNTADFIGLDVGKTTLLGTVNYADGVAGDAFTIDVLEAIESDTDGIVQFVLHNSNGLVNFATHDHAQEAWRPFITVREGTKAKAKRPSPSDGAEDVDLSPVLGWKSGGFAARHDVYFGTVFDDVNSASAGSPLLVSPAQDANTYQPGRLEFGRTYFWRIDEINAPPDSTAFRGDIWSFTTEPYAYPVSNVTATASSSASAGSSPQKTVDGSGLNASDLHDTTDGTMWLSTQSQQPPVWIQYEFDRIHKLHQMWVWNSNNGVESIIGLGVKTATIEYSADGATWTALANVPEFAQAPGAAGYAHNTTVDFGGVAAKFVRMILTSNWGGQNQYSLSEVRFFSIPVLARDPKPATGAANVSPDTTLSWRTGRGAASHEVYLGTDPNALTLAGTASTNSYAPADLLLGTQYYWRIDEVNAAEAVSTWAGDVWTFTTTEFVVIDDFESYTNDSPNRVFQTWIDGLGFSSDEFFPKGNTGNGTGAAVGYDPMAGPIMERQIVHGGRQSMPLSYDGLSETTRTFDAAQDWTQGGIKTLVLFFQGATANTPGELYVKINGTKVPYGGGTGDLASAEWKQWNIDLPSGAGLGAVRTLTIGVSAGKGTLCIDDIRLYRSAPVVSP